MTSPRYFVSMYTDGPATRWNVIDRQTQEWIRRFSTEAEAQADADGRNKAANKGRPGRDELLNLSKRIEAGLNAEMDADTLFAPPLSRAEWWMIASSLDYAARFDADHQGRV